MNPRGIFVTGTGTGVGKTFVAVGIARLLKSRGFDIGVMKPVATGEPPSEDAALLARAAECKDPIEDINPICFPEPLAPIVAARRCGSTIELEKVWSAFQSIANKHEFLIVEGIGGLLVPLADGLSVADLAKGMGLRLLIVARTDLGTINHTLLTIEAARARSLPIAGVVLNEVEQSEWGVPEQTNAEEIAAHSGVRVLGIIHYCANACDVGVRADAVAKALDIEALVEEMR